MSKEPNRNVYVGHRYVPKIMGEWDKTQEYEGLSIVTHQGGSYTSKKRVPVGIDILNEEFWVVTGNYNAQIEYYREETERVSTKLDSKSDKAYVDNELLKKSDKTYVDDQIVNVKNVFKEVNKTITSFNAVGDGIKDNTLNIQNAIDYISENGGGELLIPSGDFLVKGSLTLKNGVNVKGFGRKSRLIIDHDNIAIDVLKLSTGTTPLIKASYEGGYIKEISIIKKDDDFKGTGIRMLYFDRSIIHDVYIRGFEKGIDTSGGSWSSTISNCYMHNNIYGIYLFGLDEDLNNPNDSLKPMVRTGFNGGTITGNEIHGNYYGVYFEGVRNGVSQYHSHGAWIKNNIIEGNMIRGIYHANSTGALAISNNYFEKNSKGMPNPLPPHFNTSIDVINDPEYSGDIRNVEADILLHSMHNNNISSITGKVIISDNEVGDSAKVFTAIQNGSYVTIENNRLSSTAVYFWTGENQRTDYITLRENFNINPNVPYYINDPRHFIKIQNSNFENSRDFSTRGFMFSGVSESPEMDLKMINNERSYFGVVYSNSSGGYPTSNGSILGHKNMGNNYKQSWQIFIDNTGTNIYIRHAINSNTWGEWVNIGGKEKWITTPESRPSNAGNGTRIFDQSLNKPLWKTSGGWRDAMGTLV